MSAGRITTASLQEPVEPAGQAALVNGPVLDPDVTSAAPGSDGLMLRFKAVELALFTDQEAAAYLRLPSVDAVNRLVDRGLVRPCLVGGKRRYSVRELDRFIDDETERWSPMSPAEVLQRRRRAEANREKRQAQEAQLA